MGLPAMIITIDGPAGAGKSSAARRLAQRLDFEVLDTGAMYRAVGLAALRTHISLTDASTLEQLLQTLRLEMPPGKVLLNGEDVTLLIRTGEASNASSVVAAVPVVRRYLVQWQRDISRGRNMVCEGRDQGTVVFPDALCKFFLVADPLERVRRRQRELEARGEVVDRDQLVRAVEERDRRDAGRDLAPMRPAEDAVLLDTTRLGLDEVVDRMEAEVRRRLPER
jgi:cytidylate kinase